MLLEEQQPLLYPTVQQQRQTQETDATSSFLQIIICISTLTQDFPCSVDCAVTNNATHRLEANIVLSCFTLTMLGFLWKQLQKVCLVKNGSGGTVLLRVSLL